MKIKREKERKKEGRKRLDGLGLGGEQLTGKLEAAAAAATIEADCLDPDHLSCYRRKKRLD